MLACATAAGSICMVKLGSSWRDGGCSDDGGSSEVGAEIGTTDGAEVTSGGTSGDTSGGAGTAMSLEATSEPAGYLFLSVDWDNRHTRATDARLAVSVGHCNSTRHNPVIPSAPCAETSLKCVMP